MYTSKIKMNTHNELNNLTRESLFIALSYLMEEKSFEKITVTDLTKKAGTSRMAFYRNYDSKVDILKQYVNILFESYIKHFSEEIEQTPTVYDLTFYFFSYFKDHQLIIDLFIKAQRQDILLQTFNEYTEILFEEIMLEKPTEIEKQLIAGGLFNTLIYWINNGQQESEHQLAETIDKFNIFSVKPALVQN